MADFVAVLRKTLEGLGDPDSALRARVYDKARATVAGKLSALNPPPPPGVAERQRRSLEEAIAKIEREYAAAAADDPLSELESVFASLKNPQPRPLAPPAPAAAAHPSSREVQAKPPAEPLLPPEEPRLPEAPRLEKKPDPADEPFLDEPDAADEPRFVERLHPEDDLATVVDRAPEDDGRRIPDRPAMESRRRGGFGRYLAAAVVLAMLAGGAFGIWLNKDAFDHLLGLSGSDSARVAAVPPADEAEPEPPVPTEAPAEAEAPAEEPGEAEAPAEEPVPVEPAAEVPVQDPAQPVADEAGKFTQRLTPEGAETDPGPAGGEPGVGEGTSVAALTQPPPAAEALPPLAADPTPVAEPAPAAEAAPVADAAQAIGPDDGEAAVVEQETAAADPDAASPAPGAAAPAAPAVAAAEPAESVVQVGQKAIFYEEKTPAAEGSAEPGSIIWSLVQESPGGNLPAEPAIRAEATIPGKDVQLRMTIKRNADQTLPASHIIEMIFLTPEGFEGGGIEHILRVAMKSSEQEAGNQLIGIPAKIADGFFLFALNDTKAEIDANLTLLRRQTWIDVPVVYKSGRRALLTMEKGIPGDKVFDEALKAWQAATAG